MKQYAQATGKQPQHCPLKPLLVAGRAEVFPWWTTGFWQSKNRYNNQSVLLEVRLFACYGERPRQEAGGKGLCQSPDPVGGTFALQVGVKPTAHRPSPSTW